MNKAFWRGFVSHRLHVVLTGVAIALGVSLMAGTYMLTDTLNASYTGVMGSVYAGAAAVVSPYHPLGDDFSAQVSPITDAMLQRVREVPGVGNAAGEIMSDVTFLNAKGEAIGSTRGRPISSSAPTRRPSTCSTPLAAGSRPGPGKQPLTRTPPPTPACGWATPSK